MPEKIIAGNWKMHTDLVSAKALAANIATNVAVEKSIVVLIPPFPFIAQVAGEIGNAGRFFTGAQNVSSFDIGAYTGEVAAEMLRSVGAVFVLVGHSERRAYFGESDAVLLKKVEMALQYGLRPVFCCGEPLEVRDDGSHTKYVESQIEAVMGKLEPHLISQVIIAYEPIWAIGTGKTATPEQVQEMHTIIRNKVAALSKAEIAQKISILYGGSVNASNANALFSQPDVDGGLVGGASLNANEFIDIIRIMEELL